VTLGFVTGVEPQPPGPEWAPHHGKHRTRRAAGARLVWRADCRRDGKCSVDVDGLCEQVGDRWDAFAIEAREWARTKTSMATLRDLMSGFGLRPIPAAYVGQITAPTSLIWGQLEVDVLTARLRLSRQAGGEQRR
jgi:hypothetical protein